MLIDNRLLDDLLQKAQESPRLRINMDLRNSEADGSQRMLNALLPGTALPIHRHRASSETVCVLRGSITEIFYDDYGNETDRFLLSPAKGTYGLQIPKDKWHTLIAHEPTVIIESKDGAWAPLAPDESLQTK